MPRIGVSYEQVAAMADELMQHQRSVTIEKVRHALGSGSHLTLSKHLNRWRRERGIGIPQPGSDDSRGPPEPISRSVEQVWRELQQASQARLEQTKAEAESQVREALAREQAALERASAALKQAEGLQDKVDALQQELARLNRELASEQASRLAAERERQTLREQMLQVKELSTRMESQRRDDVREAQAAVREERQRSGLLRGRLEGQLQRIQTELEDVTSRAHAASLGWAAKEARYLERLDAYAQQLTAARAECTRYHEQIMSLVADNRELEVSVRRYKEQLMDTERAMLAQEKRLGEELLAREQSLRSLVSERAVLEERLRTRDSKARRRSGGVGGSVA